MTNRYKSFVLTSDPSPAGRRHKPPLFYPNAIRDAIVQHLPGIAAAALPITAIVLAIWLIEGPGLRPRMRDPMNTLGLTALLLGPLTVPSVFLITRRLPNFDLDGLALLVACACFAIWGVVASLLGLCFFAPITCTAAWAMSVAMLIGGRRAWHFLILLAIPTNGALLVNMRLLSGLVVDNFFLPPILVWHLLHPFALAVAAELRHRDLAYLRTVCKRCGYPREGLAPDAPCPECGLA